MLLLIDATLLQ